MLIKLKKNYMNWINNVLVRKSRLIDKHRPTKEEIEKSDWISCCMGQL